MSQLIIPSSSNGINYDGRCQNIWFSLATYQSNHSFCFAVINQSRVFTRTQGSWPYFPSSLVMSHLGLCVLCTKTLGSVPCVKEIFITRVFSCSCCLLARTYSRCPRLRLLITFSTLYQCLVCLWMRVQTFTEWGNERTKCEMYERKVLHTLCWCWCCDGSTFLVPPGLQSPGAARSTQRHDERRLHGATPSLVLLHHSRTSAVWDQSDLGVQSGQTTEHRNPHVGHRQVRCQCKSYFLSTFVVLISTFS